MLQRAALDMIKLGARLGDNLAGIAYETRSRGCFPRRGRGFERSSGDQSLANDSFAPKPSTPSMDSSVGPSMGDELASLREVITNLSVRLESLEQRLNEGKREKK